MPTITQLTQGGDATNLGASGTYSTASVSPADGSLLLLCGIVNASIADPTITGLGLTWTKVNSVPYNTSGSPVDLLFVFKATVSGTPSGAITITVADNVTNGNWKVLQVTGQHATTPIPQSAVDTTDSGSDTTQPTLGAFGSASNYTLLAVAIDVVTGSFSFEAGYTELGTPQATAETSSELTVAYLNGNDTTPTATFSASTRDMASIALEIAAAAGGGSGNPHYAYAQQ